MKSTTPPNPENLVASRYDAGKKGLELLPIEVMFDLNEIYRFGARKYAPGNWLKGMDWSKCANSGQRHFQSWSIGQELDEESQQHHLLHAIWNLVTLYYYQKHRLGRDDRGLDQKGFPNDTASCF